jgi:hypothetical protein
MLLVWLPLMSLALYYCVCPWSKSASSCVVPRNLTVNMVTIILRAVRLGSVARVRPYSHIINRTPSAVRNICMDEHRSLVRVRAHTGVLLYKGNTHHTTTRHDTIRHAMPHHIMPHHTVPYPVRTTTPSLAEPGNTPHLHTVMMTGYLHYPLRARPLSSPPSVLALSSHPHKSCATRLLAAMSLRGFHRSKQGFVVSFSSFLLSTLAIHDLSRLGHRATRILGTSWARPGLGPVFLISAPKRKAALAVLSKPLPGCRLSPPYINPGISHYPPDLMAHC